MLSQEKLLAELRARTTEMIDAATARKGERFAAAVNAVFEGCQASDMLGTLKGICNDAGVKAEGLFDGILACVSTASARTMTGMSDADQQEVMATAQAMFRERQRIQEQYVRGLRT
jgi:hypothetical protein